MGSAMETFCCANKEESYNNNNDSHITDATGLLPSNKIMSENDLIKIIQLNSTKDIPFTNYELIEKLGEGECGEVFIIKNKSNKNVFALRKLKRNKSTNLSENEISQEIENLKQLNHAYINKIYEYYISEDYIFLIEDFCSEGNIQDKLKTIKIMPEFIVKIVMFQLFKALIYLASKNIIHGNIKLENILIELNEIDKEKKRNKKNIAFPKDKFMNAIDSDISLLHNHLGNKGANYKYDIREIDSIKIINKKINESQKKVESNVSTGLRFGSSKAIDDKLKAIPNLKYSGSNNIYNAGKFEILKYGIKLNDFNCSNIFVRNKNNLKNIIYSTPEKITNEDNNNNEYNDIWDCGIIMYYLLGGIFPFQGNNIEEIKQKIALGKFIFDFDKFNGISEDAKDLIKKCLRMDANRRLTIIEALSHPFFDNLKDSKIYLEDEKQILNNLKNNKEYHIFYQMVLTFISHNFNDKQLLHELSRIFYKIDRNSDGKITKEDLENAYEEAGEKISKSELEKIINTVDFDKNGFIEYDEFIRVCIPEDRLFTEANLRNAFNLFDTEKKGSIKHMQVVDALQRENKINPKMIELLKKEVSNMGDELLDFDKFKKLMEELSVQ